MVDADAGPDEPGERLAEAGGEAEGSATVDISRYEGLLTSIEWREKKVGDLSDEELTEAAAKLRRAGRRARLR